MAKLNVTAAEYLELKRILREAGALYDGAPVNDIVFSQGLASLVGAELALRLYAYGQVDVSISSEEPVIRRLQLSLND